jgi:hypothetical protein
MEPIRAKLKGLREWEGRIVAFVPIVKHEDHYTETKVAAVFICDEDGEILWSYLNDFIEIKKGKSKP